MELGNQVAGKLKDLEGNCYFFLYKSHILEGKFDILEGKLDFGCREDIFSSTAYHGGGIPQTPATISRALRTLGSGALCPK